MIKVSHRKYGMFQGSFQCIHEVEWSIIIDKKSLPQRKGNSKFQIIEGQLGGIGIRKLEKAGYNLIYRDNHDKC